MTSSQADKPLDPTLIVLRDFELFSKGRDHIEELLECFAEDVAFRDNTSPEIRNGRTLLREYTMAIYDAFPDLKVENVRLTTQGRTVASEMEFVGTHEGTFMGIPASGRIIRWSNCTVYEVNDDNKIARESYYFDSGSIVAQMCGEA